MPYQDFTSMQSILSESSRAVYDMGCKLHTLLLKNACTNPEEDGFKKINLLTRWPAMIQEQITSAEFDTNIRTPRDVDTANGISRVLLTQLINSLRDETRHLRSGFKISNSVHRNLVHITLQIEELILSSQCKKIDMSTYSTEMRNHSEVNESLFRWVQRDFLLYLSGSADSHQLWAEWDLVEALLTQLNQLFPEQMFGHKVISQSESEAMTTEQGLHLSSIDIEQNVINLLQNKNGIDYSMEVEILMYESNPQNLQV